MSRLASLLVLRRTSSSTRGASARLHTAERVACRVSSPKMVSLPCSTSTSTYWPDTVVRTGASYQGQ